MYQNAYILSNRYSLHCSEYETFIIAAIFEDKCRFGSNKEKPLVISNKDSKVLKF